jgi:hypothetical protein
VAAAPIMRGDITGKVHLSVPLLSNFADDGDASLFCFSIRRPNSPRVRFRMEKQVDLFFDLGEQTSQTWWRW